MGGLVHRFTSSQFLGLWLLLLIEYLWISEWQSQWSFKAGKLLGQCGKRSWQWRSHIDIILSHFGYFYISKKDKKDNGMREKINSSSGGTGTRILTFQYPKKSVDKREEDCFSFHIFGQDFSQSCSIHLGCAPLGKWKLIK